MKDFHENEPLYIISIAAKLAGVHPQTLRLYEREGIIKPKRSAGNVRFYSLRDIKRTREARRIIQQYGVSICGVKLILKLEEEVERLQNKVRELEEELNRIKSLSKSPEER
jgi:MerR family transcriptional regulator/heat shock protein HspR